MATAKLPETFPRPPYCGRPDCDPVTRMVEVGEDRVPTRCPCLREMVSLVELLDERERLRARLLVVDRAIAEAEDAASDWVRGPGGART